MNEKDKINLFLDNGYLVSPELLDNVDIETLENGFFTESTGKIKSKEKPLLINKEVYQALLKNKEVSEINWIEFERCRSEYERGKDTKGYELFLNVLSQKETTIITEQEEQDINEDNSTLKEQVRSVIIKKTFSENAKKRDVQQFVKYYKRRYESIRDILLSRNDLPNLTSINKLKNKNKKEAVSVAGLVFSKGISKNNNIMLTLEDKTGMIRAVVNKDREEVYNPAKNIVEDEVLGISGTISNDFIFVNKITYPDMPIKEKKYSNDEVYVAFISDVHVGSRLFLQDDFVRFIEWLNGNVGSKEQRDLANKVGYLFIVGDLVDGCGIYPSQEKELTYPDIYKQYELSAQLLSKIRKDLNIIICPGNHDAVRISEPQPALSKYAELLSKLPNVFLVSNPALVNIHASPNFSGFDILMYHGYSFDYYLDTVEYIRKNEGKENPSVILKFLLQKRHLAPTHSSTLYIPETDEDPLFIEKIPDIFVTGHLHKSSVGSYNNVITICCSCWQSKTDFQEKCGHNPDPGKVPIINLKTREVSILKFGEH